MVNWCRRLRPLRVAPRLSHEVCKSEERQLSLTGKQARRLGAFVSLLFAMRPAVSSSASGFSSMVDVT